MKRIQLRIGALLINDNKSALFVKSRREKGTIVSRALVLPVFYAAVFFAFCWWMNVSFSEINLFYLGILLLVIGLPVGFDIGRSFRIAKNYEIEIVDGKAFLNKKDIGQLSKVDRVFIQPIVGWGGIGITYTVGIMVENRRWCLSFNNTEKDAAIEIANELCSLLNTSFILQQQKIFTLYMGY